jgi:hypothetical protein
MSVWSAPIDLCPTKKTRPFSGGCLKFFSLERIDEMAACTFFLVDADLMLDD